MKRILTILLFALSVKAHAYEVKRTEYFPGLYFTTYTFSVSDGMSQNGHTGGYFVINGDLAGHPGGVDGFSSHQLNLVPGDIIQFHGGQYYAINLQYFTGFYGLPIEIREVAGETVKIGDQLWGATYTSWSYGIKTNHCKHIWIHAQTFGEIILTGSTQGGFSPSGVNQSYSNVALGDFSEHSEVSNLWIQDGGHGIWFKTEVSGSNALSWDNLETRKLTGWNIHDNLIERTADEGMYGGHTGTWWNISTNAPYYPTDSNDVTASSDTLHHKRPLKLDSVHIHHNILQNVRIDGIQCAAMDHLEIDHNTVHNWAYVRIGNPNAVDIAGILIGGRCTHTNTHDNIVHDGWGDCIQVFCEGPNHTISNNLIYRTWYGEGISIRSTGGTVPMSNLVIQYNTVSEVGSHCTRTNMFFGRRDYVYMNANLFIQPYGQYLYTENGGLVQEGTLENLNNKYVDLAHANVNTACYYKPYNISVVSGYRSDFGCGLPKYYTAHRNTGRRFKLKQG